VREDIYRFVYERAKLMSQKETEGMSALAAEDLSCYPGSFLGDDLEEKIGKSCRLLSEEYLDKGDAVGSQESLRNIELVITDSMPDIDPFEHLCKLQKRWNELMLYSVDKKFSVFPL